jgi:hypothetical protein
LKDRNKTELTHKVTVAAVRYLDERGFKPLQCEVAVCEGWVADIAGCISPTITELIDLKLLKRKPAYRHPTYNAWMENAKQVDKFMTVLVEVKTSRGDFRGDRKWTLPVPTNLAYLAVPKGMFTSGEMPPSWGVLEYTEDYDSLRCVQIPTINPTSLAQHVSVVFETAIRLDHQTRYAHLREMRREQTVRKNESVSRLRIHSAIRAVAAIAKGEHGSVEGALEYHGIRTKLHEHDMDYLRTVWQLKVK